MFYVEEIKMNCAAELLAKCGLSEPQGVDYTAGVFCAESGSFSTFESTGGFRSTAGLGTGGTAGSTAKLGVNGTFGGIGGFGSNGAGCGRRLAATGSLKGDMIQGMAVDPDFQGEDLTAKVLTHLFGIARERGHRTLYLFTKPEKAGQFIGLGFRRVAGARPYATLLEWGESGVNEYMKRLAAVRKYVSQDLNGSEAGVLVMNCNPFTKGHRYLIEQAAARKKYVFVLAVEEDVSLFPFSDRLAMLQLGTADLENVKVLSGGRYAVSNLTFPSYFTKEENLAKAHAAVDAELFAACIAPALSASERFVGTEPFSQVTAVYNETLKERLPKHKIAVTEIPRLKVGGEAVSATKVRTVLAELWRSGNLTAEAVGESSALELLLPETTLEYLKREEMLLRLRDGLAEGETRDMQMAEGMPSCEAREGKL